MSTPPATGSLKGLPNKVPAIALSFWVIKIMCTTVGETGADFLAVNARWGAASDHGAHGGLAGAWL